MATKAIEDTLKSQYQEVGSEAHLALISSRNPSSSLALPTIEATAEIEATVEKKALQRKAQDTEDLSNEELRELKVATQATAMASIRLFPLTITYPYQGL